MYNIKKSFFYFILAVVITTTFSAQHVLAQGKNTTVLTDEKNNYPLNARSFIVEDLKGQLTIQDITSLYSTGEIKYRNTNPNGVALGQKKHPYWIIFTLQNQSQLANWYIDIGSMANGRAGVANKFLIYEINQRKIFYDGFQLGTRNNPSIEKSRFVPVTVPAFSNAVFLMYVFPTDYKKTNLDLSINKNTSDQSNSIASVYSSYIPTIIIGSILVILIGFFITRSVGFIPIIAFYLSILAWYLLVEKPFYNSFIGIGFLSSILPVFNAFFIGLACLLTIPARYNTSLLRISLMATLGFTIAVTCLMIFVFPIDPTIQSYLSNILSITTLVIATLYLGSNNTYYIKPSALCLAGWILFYIIGQIFKIAYIAGFLPPSFFSTHADYAVLAPQIFFIMVGVVVAVQSEQTRHLNAFIRQTQKAQSLLKAKKSKEENDHSRLLRVIEREREVMEELRSRETERTEEMRKAKINADEANHAKSAFLAVVSHEIRTPMTGIIGMIRMLQDTDLSNEQKDYLMTIKDSGDAMLALLNDILDFSKIEGGGMRLETIEFDLHRVLNGVQMLMKGHAEQKNVSFKLNIHDNVPHTLYGDPTRLRQVLLNLVGNALKFTSKGHVGINLLLDTSNQKDLSDPNMCAIYFSIEDTGIGISEDAQQKLFTPFSQADNTISRKYGGTGLGLTICKRLVEAMGGEIKLKSREGSGTTFFFTLPFKTTLTNTVVNNSSEEPAPLLSSDEIISSSKETTDIPDNAQALPEDTSQAMEEREGYTRSPMGTDKMRFLIVDDNEINRKVVKAFLEKDNHDSVIIYSGKEALSLLKDDKQFDAIFLDIEMPDMNGKDVARTILKDSNLLQIPIFALTGNVGEKDLKTYKDIGFKGYVPKPIIPEDLQNVIRNITSGEDNLGFPKETNNVDSSDASNKASPSVKDEKSTSQTKSGAPLGKTLDEKMVKGLKDGLGVKQTLDLLNDLFIKADEILENLKVAATENNMDSVLMRSHELKGMAGNFGLKAVSDKAGQLEQLGKVGDITMADVETHIEDLSTLVERSKLALDNYFND